MALRGLRPLGLRPRGAPCGSSKKFFRRRPRVALLPSAPSSNEFFLSFRRPRPLKGARVPQHQNGKIYIFIPIWYILLNALLKNIIFTLRTECERYLSQSRRLYQALDFRNCKDIGHHLKYLQWCQQCRSRIAFPYFLNPYKHP